MHPRPQYHAERAAACSRRPARTRARAMPTALCTYSDASTAPRERRRSAATGCAIGCAEALRRQPRRPTIPRPNAFRERHRRGCHHRWRLYSACCFARCRLWPVKGLTIRAIGLAAVGEPALRTMGPSPATISACSRATALAAALPRWTRPPHPLHRRACHQRPRRCSRRWRPGRRRPAPQTSCGPSLQT